MKGEHWGSNLVPLYQIGLIELKVTLYQIKENISTCAPYAQNPDCTGLEAHMHNQWPLHESLYE